MTKKIKTYFVCMCTIASIFFNIPIGFTMDNTIMESPENQTDGILLDNGSYLNEDTVLTEEESKKLIDDINNGSIRYKILREENEFSFEEENAEEYPLFDVADEESPMMTDDTEAAAVSNNAVGWQTCGNMTEARSNMASAVVGDMIYVFGGTKNGTATASNEVYDTNTNTWTSKADMDIIRYKHSAAVLDNNIYLCGGYDETDNAVAMISVYDTETNTWLGNIDTPNNNTNYASGIFNGELYIFGGKEHNEITRRGYKYNFQTATWLEVPELPKDLINEKAVPTQTGFNIFSDWDVIEYNAEFNTYTIVDHIPREVEGYAVTVKDVYENGEISKTDAICISGGHDSNSTVSIANVKTRYIGDNAQDNEWFNDLRLIRGLSEHNMVIANGNIYVYGGQVFKGTDQGLMFKRSLYEQPDDMTSTSNINLNTYAYGSINYNGDSDVFLFTPTANGKYEISAARPVHSNNTQYKWHVEISEFSTGKRVSYCYLPQILSGIQLKAGVTYSIKISDEKHSSTGNYMFRIRSFTGDDVPDTVDAAKTIQTNITYSQNVSGVHDRDFFKINVPHSGKYALNIETDRYEYGYKIQVGMQIVPDTIYYPYNDFQVIIYNSEGGEIKRYTLPETYSDHNPLRETIVELSKGDYYISVEPSEYDFENHDEHGIDGLYYDNEHTSYTIRLEDSETHEDVLTQEKRMNVVSGETYLLAVTASNMENIQNKVFTVDFDGSKLALEDACAQTWKKDTAVGTIEDTDINILLISDSQIKFKANKALTPITGTVNIIKFKALTNGEITITVTSADK